MDAARHAIQVLGGELEGRAAGGLAGPKRAAHGGARAQGAPHAAAVPAPRGAARQGSAVREVFYLGLGHKTCFCPTPPQYPCRKGPPAKASL